MHSSRFGPFGFVVLALAALLNVAALYTAESSFAALRDAVLWVRHTEDAGKRIEHVYRRAVDAETGQRGFLLTLDTTYLQPYADARLAIPRDLDELGRLTEGNPVQVAQLATVRKLLESRFAQMEESLALKRDRGDDALRAFLVSHEGMVTMNSLRLALDGMAAEERTQNERRIQALTDNQNRVRRGLLLVVGLNLLLVTLGGVFLGQASRRRRREAAEAMERNAQLEVAIGERTAELRGLSHYLQQMQDEEKAKIAREIHDELGGTLAAAKIDLQLASDKLPAGDPQRARLLRVMAAIDETIRFKRRIIEDLRPTLLDNLGIGAALKWQCSQFSKRTNVPCRVETPDDSLRLPPAYSIAFYRVVQEALTNITKYAQPKNVAVSLHRDGDQWVLRVADDGVGIDMAKRHNPTAHGLVSMRERARSLGGDFSIQGRPERGTVVEIRVPVRTEPAGQAPSPAAPAAPVAPVAPVARAAITPKH
jgi:signal transduction histidine kinase